MPSILNKTVVGNKPPPAPPKLRPLGDAPSTRKMIYDNVLHAASTLPEVANTRHTLRLSNVNYVDPDDYDLPTQKQAILGGKTLGRRLVGTWSLHDKVTGQPLEEKQMTVARVPYLSDRGTFIHNGTEYGVRHQMRLRSGIYVREKSNGDYEAHLNTLSGKGFSHRYFLDPAKNLFHIEVGQAHIPLMPLLKALGAKDKQLLDAWGPEIYHANAQKNDPATLRKLYQKLVKKTLPNVDEPGQQQAIADVMAKMELDPEVTRRTLGKPLGKVDVDTLLETTKKLLAVSRGEAEVDDRDHLAYQTIHGPEDLLAERLSKDYGGLRRNLLFKSSFKGNLSGVQPGVLTKQLESAILHSGLGSPLEEVNPGELLDNQTKISRMGEGGIGSLDAIPDECYDDQTEVFTDVGWIAWSQADASTKFACKIDGRLSYHTSHRLFASEYVGDMYGVKTRTLDYLVTPTHRNWVRKYRSTGSVRRSGMAAWQFEAAKDTHGRPRQFQITHFAVAGTRDRFFVLPTVPGARKKYRFSFDDWGSLVGWYASEGSIDSYALRKYGKYVITITQTQKANPENVQRIAALLTRMGIAYSYQVKNFVFTSKQIGTWLEKHLGRGALHKRLPIACFSWPQSARERMLESSVAGDGSTAANGAMKFGSGSRKLMEDVSRLGTTLGYAVRERKVDTRRGTHLHRGRSIRKLRDYYVCGFLLSDYQGVTATHNKKSRNNYYIRAYRGKVYCAEVPGGLLLVRRNKSVPMWSGNSRAVQPSHMGFIDGVRTPESTRIGVDLNLAGHVLKGDDHRIYIPVRDVKTGELVHKSPQDLMDETIAFPGELTGRKTKRVGAMQGGKLGFFRRDQIKYELPHFEKAFSHIGNLVPLKSGIKAQRLSMGSRMITQALPLEHAEAPLVQTGMPDQADRSYEEEYGKHMGAVFADRPGRVTAIKPGMIQVQYADGSVGSKPLYENFPFSRKTGIHNTPVVKPGDIFHAGQVLAKSNYTDDKGVTALGLNARVGFLAYKGHNFEDAVTISQSLADRMKSQHTYWHQLEWSPQHKRTKRDFISVFPSRFNRQTLAKLDEDGTAKVGAEIHFGEPLILAAKQRENVRGKIHRRGESSWADETEIWQHHSPAIVTDVVKGEKGTTVQVKTTHAMGVADKLSGLHGNKGIVANIVPDDEMPQDAQGRPLEALLNPLGIISRGNPAAIAATALGKIAAQTGRPYKVVDFDKIADLNDYVQQELKKHGVQALETVTDPETGRKIPNVLVGNSYLLKLHHISESKAQGRGSGGYSSDDTPARGGPQGSKRLSVLHSNALLSAGAVEVLRDAGAIRGQRNEEFWLPFMQGHSPPKPKVPMVYEKFVNELKGSGINVVPDGTRLNIMALTDKDVDKLAGNREILNGETVRFDKGLEAIAGGLFDPALTGSHLGNRWSFIRLHEPMPSPVMEEPVRRILGLTQAKFRDVLAGKESIGGNTGPGAITAALKNINLPHELEVARTAIASGRKTARDAAVRKLGYLKSAERLGIHPGDWVLSKVPVLPPRFRPISVMGPKKLPLVSDVNYLYKELLEANTNLKEMQGQVDDVGEERLAVYDAFKAVTGLGEPVHPRLQEKGVTGLLAKIFGGSPKHSTLQRRLISANVDLVGRGSVAPDPDLDLDSIGIPEQQAWDVYKNFVVRRLKRRGMSLTDAARQVMDRTAIAKQEMLSEMAERPVITVRDPVLHKFGALAFWPKLVKGDSIRTNPLINKGYNLDYDGDQMSFHAPVSEEAKREAVDRLLPSRNLLSPADFKTPMPSPTQEYTGGLFQASAKKNNKPEKTFRTVADVRAAFARGDLDIGDPIRILT